MDRATKKLLGLKMHYLERITKRTFLLQRAYNQGYKLYEIYEQDGRRVEHELTSYRLDGNEMRWYLAGMIDAIEMERK